MTDEQLQAQATVLAYKRVFRSPAGQQVLQDLAQFCRSFETAYQENDRLTYVTIGRQEVFWRIANLIDVKLDDMFKLRRKDPIPTFEADL